MRTFGGSGRGATWYGNEESVLDGLMMNDGRAMIDHTIRLNGVVRDEIRKQTLGKESVGYAVGLSFGTVPIDQQGQVYIGPLWMVTLTMRSPLLTHEDIGRSLPVFGVMPKDDLFRQIVGRLLEECRKERDETAKV